MLLLASAMLVASSVATYGQSITLPPDGDNQRSEVVQQIGMVAPRSIPQPGCPRPQTARIAAAKSGAAGAVGASTTRVSTTAKGPWRAGANENTVFSVSHPR